MSTPTLPAPIHVMVPIPARYPEAAQGHAERMAAVAGGWPDWRTAHWTVEQAPSLGPSVLALHLQVTVREVAP